MFGELSIAIIFAILVANGEEHVRIVCQDGDQCTCPPITDLSSEYKINCTSSSLNSTWIEPINNALTYVEISFDGSQLTKLVREHITRLHPDHVKRYNFANNQITDIEDHAFDKCTSLQALDLRNNKLTKVDIKWFQGLWTTLLTLELSDNQISTIPDRVFAHLSNLKFLNLNNNPIVKLTDQTFGGLYFLEQLSLDGTQISEISGTVFTSYTTPNLRTLSVQRSKMEHLPRLRNLTYLNRVDFSRNDNIDVVHTKTFANVPSVSHISLDFMKKLKTIKDCAFCELPSLKFILISDSPKLTEIPKSAFDVGLGYGTSLDVVDFSNNSLTTIHPKMFPWKSVNSVLLEGNKWNCSCEILWMTDRSISIINNPKCFSPPGLKNAVIKNLTKNNFGIDCMRRTSYRTPKIFIAMTIMLVVSGGVLITWYVWSSRKQEGGISHIFKTNPLVKQPYAYRNLAMHQEDGEQIVQNRALDQEEEDDAPYPPFDKDHNNKAALV